MKEEEALVRVVRVVRGSRNSKGVSAINLTVKCAKTAKVCMPVSPCSCRSRCSRFIEFKGSARYNFHRESFSGLDFLVRAVRVVRGS